MRFGPRPLGESMSLADEHGATAGMANARLLQSARLFIDTHEQIVLPHFERFRSHLYASLSLLPHDATFVVWLFDGLNQLKKWTDCISDSNKEIFTKSPLLARREAECACDTPYYPPLPTCIPSPHIPGS